MMHKAVPAVVRRDPESLLLSLFLAVARRNKALRTSIANYEWQFGPERMAAIITRSPIPDAPTWPASTHSATRTSTAEPPGFSPPRTENGIRKIRPGAAGHGVRTRPISRPSWTATTVGNR